MIIKSVVAACLAILLVVAPASGADNAAWNNLDLGHTRLIIAECERLGLPRNQAAYVLATAYHESAHTMKPVREYGGETYLRSKSYYPCVGMGYVQLTWKTNYRKASEKLGVNFIQAPTKLFEPRYAAPDPGHRDEGALVRRQEALRLHVAPFEGARRVINGMAEMDGIPIDDDCGQEVEAGDPVVLPLRRTITDFTLATDT